MNALKFDFVDTDRIRHTGGRSGTGDNMKNMTVEFKRKKKTTAQVVTTSSMETAPLRDLRNRLLTSNDQLQPIKKSLYTFVAFALLAQVGIIGALLARGTSAIPWLRSLVDGRNTHQAVRTASIAAAKRAQNRAEIVRKVSRRAHGRPRSEVGKQIREAYDA